MGKTRDCLHRGRTPHGLPGFAEVWLQGEGDLGDRLERILSRALQQFPSAIAIGADSPGLPIDFLEQTRDALQAADAVIGPCEDGGFYLLALRSCPPGIFSGISWSQPTTCDETIAKLRAAHLVVRVLKPRFDVDTAKDLARLSAHLTANQIHAPNTKDFLARVAPSPSALRAKLASTRGTSI